MPVVFTLDISQSTSTHHGVLITKSYSIYTHICISLKYGYDRAVVGEMRRMYLNMFQTRTDAPICSQFDSVADISDVSSNVTLKSYTMHFEVPLCAAWMHDLLHGVWTAQWNAGTFPWFDQLRQNPQVFRAAGFYLMTHPRSYSWNDFVSDVNVNMTAD